MVPPPLPLFWLLHPHSLPSFAGAAVCDADGIPTSSFFVQWGDGLLAAVSGGVMGRRDAVLSLRQLV